MWLCSDILAVCCVDVFGVFSVFVVFGMSARRCVDALMLLCVCLFVCWCTCMPVYLRIHVLVDLHVGAYMC